MPWHEGLALDATRAWAAATRPPRRAYGNLPATSSFVLMACPNAGAQTRAGASHAGHRSSVSTQVKAQVESACARFDAELAAATEQLRILSEDLISRYVDARLVPIR